MSEVTGDPLHMTKADLERALREVAAQRDRATEYANAFRSERDSAQAQRDALLKAIEEHREDGERVSHGRDTRLYLTATRIEEEAGK